MYRFNRNRLLSLMDRQFDCNCNIIFSPAQVSNMEAAKPYVFNIVNMEKHNSQYKTGMQPIMFSVKDYTEFKKGWTRTGMDICYYRNCYKNCNKSHGSYMTATFSIQFPHDRDICYIAYVYPYTYSKLLVNTFN